MIPLMIYVDVITRYNGLVLKSAMIWLQPTFRKVSLKLAFNAQINFVSKRQAKGFQNAK